MTKTMLEKLASQIDRAVMLNTDARTGLDSEAVARAVLGVLRKPTDDMIRAGREENEFLSSFGVSSLFSAMIDQAIWGDGKK